MAKLYFYYASMNAGKSTNLLQADFNYRERGMRTMLFTAAIDDRFAAVTITEVRMSPDLRHATVFVKPLLGKDEEKVLKALRTNTAYLQREVANRVQMRYAAKLKFLADESFDEGTHIDTLLRDPHIARDLAED